MESAPGSPIAQEVQQAAERVLAGYEQEQALAESQGLIAQGGGVYVTPEQREQALQESQTRAETRMLLGSIESQGGVQGAIEAGNIDKVRDAVDKGLFQIRDTADSSPRKMTQLDIVNMQINISDKRDYNSAMLKLKETAPQAITSKGVYVRNALEAGVDASVLRTLGIPDSEIQKAQKEAQVTQEMVEKGLRPPLEDYIANYSSKHPVEFPEGIKTFARLNYLNDAMARQRIEATKEYRDKYGPGGLAAGTALAIGEVFTPAFKILEPTIGIGKLSILDKIIIGAQIASIVIPVAISRMSPKVAGSVVKYAPGTEIEDIVAGRAKGLVTTQTGIVSEGPAVISGEAPAIWSKGSKYYVVYGETGKSFGVPVSSLHSFGEPLRVVYTESGGVSRPLYYIGKQRINLEGEWNPGNLSDVKETGFYSPRTPQGGGGGGGVGTAPALETGRMTPENVARLGAAEPGTVNITPLFTPGFTNIPSNEPYPLSPNMPIVEPMPLPGSPPAVTPSTYPPQTPVIPNVQPITPPVSVVVPEGTSEPTPTIVDEPTPVTEITPTPEPIPVIPEAPPVVPVISEPPPPPALETPPPPPVKKIPPPFVLGGSGSLYRGGDYSGSTIATSLQGQVRDILTNLPIPKALVKVISSAGAKAQKLTNKKGMYQFNDINPDYYTVISTKEGYDPIQAKTLVNVGENRLDIKPRQSVTRTIQAPNLTTIVSPPALSPNLRAMPPAVSSRPGIIALKRGREWAVIYPPYQPNNLVHMIQPPAGATVAKSIGQMFKLVQSMGGNGSVLINLYQGNKHDDARWNSRTINVQDPVALEKWLKRPGRGDVVGKDTPMYKPRKPARAVMIKRS
jgi:hypothetical protein